MSTEKAKSLFSRARACADVRIGPSAKSGLRRATSIRTPPLFYHAGLPSPAGLGRWKDGDTNKPAPYQRRLSTRAYATPRICSLELYDRTTVSQRIWRRRCRHSFPQPAIICNLHAQWTGCYCNLSPQRVWTFRLARDLQIAVWPASICIGNCTGHGKGASHTTRCARKSARASRTLRTVRTQEQ